VRKYTARRERCQDDHLPKKKSAMGKKEPLKRKNRYSDLRVAKWVKGGGVRMAGGKKA